MEEKKKRLEDARNEVKNLQEESKKLEMGVQAENDLMAKAKIKLPAAPALETGGSKVRLPPATTGMFINKFQGLGVSGGVNPNSDKAVAKLSVQLS